MAWGEVHGFVNFHAENRALVMLRNDPNQPEFLDFYLPFGGKLQTTNRWVKLAAMMPWSVVESCYSDSLAGTGMGSPARSGRIAYGALVIKERLGLTDEETVEQIRENPYLQYFLGLHEFRQEPLFDPSLMVHFRSRFTEDHHRRINEEIITQATTASESDNDSNDDGGEGKLREETAGDDSDSPSHEGKLLVDASCTPADITYPTDLKLLGEAREKTEHFIDVLHAPSSGKMKKPRTYRRKARKQHLAVAKQKSPGRKKIRKAIGQQLRYIKRNLGHIDEMLGRGASLEELSGYELKCLQVIHELYRQQSLMFHQNLRSVPDRIVSISQPHVRPIVRAKAGKKVEFGAKISIAHLAGGYVALDRVSWDPYNESADLIGQVEGYHRRFGYYPKSVHADAIYRTRANRAWCKEHGIRLSGKPLGRPPKETSENAALLKARRKQTRQDELDRIPVEGKFGNAKRKGTLDRIMAKLAHTSESVIHVGIVVMNLDQWLRQVLFWLFCRLGLVEAAFTPPADGRKAARTDKQPRPTWPSFQTATCPVV